MPTNSEIRDYIEKQRKGGLPLRVQIKRVTKEPKWKIFKRFEIDGENIIHIEDKKRFPYKLQNIIDFDDKPKKPPLPITTYGVYVVELDGDPHHVYVGQTAKSFEERLKEHNSGSAKNGAGTIFRSGVRGKLRPDLYRHLPRVYSKDEAIKLETKIATKLDVEDFRVEGDGI